LKLMAFLSSQYRIHQICLFILYLWKRLYFFKVKPVTQTFNNLFPINY
jgi:hypothetical protein